MIVAICGKGGVGKTTVAAITAKELSEKKDLKALVVDADPAGGLSMALGLMPKKTINDVRKEIVEEIKAGLRDEKDLAISLDYLLNTAIKEYGNLAILAIGRPEDEGCYCRVNVILKDAIEGLAENFDIALIDAEAGIEQVNRKVLSAVDYMLLITDTSVKGLKVAETILSVGKRMTAMRGAGLIINRVRDTDIDYQTHINTPIEILGVIPEDETVKRFDEEGKSFLEIPPCPARESLKALLNRAGLLGNTVP